MDTLNRRSTFLARLSSTAWVWALRLALCGMIPLGCLILRYSGFQPSWWRTLQVLGFAVWGLSLFWRKTRSPSSALSFTGISAALLVWWATIPPSNLRNWRPEVRIPPSAVIQGNLITLRNIRNFDYVARYDFTERREERTVDLDHLVGVDFFISHWDDGPVAHTFVSFTFDNADPLCISIEARLEQEEKYALIPSLFKQFELIYLVGEERDIVAVRTNHRSEKVYLYRSKATPTQARAIFMVYVEKINEIAINPEFYHPLRNNCTVNIDRHIDPRGVGSPFDIRLLLNARADEFAYDKGWLDDSLPFDQLRAASLISPAALSTGDSSDFSSIIREHLPKIPQTAK